MIPVGRRLTPGERALARAVFADALPLEGVRIAPTPFRTAVTLGSVILMPADAPRDFAAAPLALQAWLVHELTHVWQFATAPARTLRSWAGVVASGGYGPGLPGYAYAHPFDWTALNLEQQARVVEHAFLIREGAAVEAEAPSGSTPRRWATRADYAGRTPFEALTGVRALQAAA